MILVDNLAPACSMYLVRATPRILVTLSSSSCKLFRRVEPLVYGMKTTDSISLSSFWSFCFLGKVLGGFLLLVDLEGMLLLLLMLLLFPRRRVAPSPSGIGSVGLGRKT